MKNSKAVTNTLELNGGKVFWSKNGLLNQYNWSIPRRSKRELINGHQKKTSFRYFETTNENAKPRQRVCCAVLLFKFGWFIPSETQ
jgi:acid phosphatase class B